MTFHSIMRSRREFNSMKINVTTKMTPLCWQRFEMIVEEISLENLAVDICDPRQTACYALTKVLMKLPVNSLKQLSLSNVIWEHFHQFLIRQKSITNLSITGAIGEVEFIKSLSLTHLILIGPKSGKIASIIEKQNNLISLKLVIDKESDYNNQVFTKIVGLSKLECLDIPLNLDISQETIHQLSKLKSLKTLNVSCFRGSFDEIIRTSLPSLKELDLILVQPGDKSSIDLLAHSAPNLQSIKLRGPLIVNFLSAIAMHYAKLESLWIENVESYYVNIVNLRATEKFNLKLKHLFIINHDRKVVLCANDLIRFIKTFPMLETLVITKYSEIHLSNVEVLLKHLPNLREIIIDSKSIDSTTNIMNVIRNHGEKLNFVKLENFRLQTDIESLKVFFDGKFTVVEKCEANLMMRNDEKLYLCNVMS